MGRLEETAGVEHTLAVTSRTINQVRVENGKDKTRHQAAVNDADARVWAAAKLLEQLKTLPAPEIPIDHTVGQSTIEDALKEGP